MHAHGHIYTYTYTLAHTHTHTHPHAHTHTHTNTHTPAPWLEHPIRLCQSRFTVRHVPDSECNGVGVKLVVCKLA